MGDKKSSKPSKADIAKQFDLPERQSKIATLLNQAGQAYCICRSSDSSRFMIGCDACEEWYHGDCINISEREAKYIRLYYCDRCRQEDPSLTTHFKPRKRDRDQDRDSGHEDYKKKRKEHSEGKNKKPTTAAGNEAYRGTGRCGVCPGCIQTFDCGNCDTCREVMKYGQNNKIKLICKQRLCTNADITTRDTKYSRNKHRTKEVLENNEKPVNNSSDDLYKNEYLPHLHTTTPRQCYGPKCAKTALDGSKYCSPECGMRLATTRIYQVLPQRIQEWSLQGCIAESGDRKALVRIRAQLKQVKAALQHLEIRRAELDEMVAKAKMATPIPHTEDSEEESEMSMYCITCGYEIHSRTAIKHMEKCFNKHEAQSSFGSVFKTRIEGNNMFCDYYNHTNRTYCKRLRVLCPEHCKEPKVGDTDVCGCPLVKQLFAETGEFCRAPKKSCLKHHAWEKLRRAEIDMERVRQWLKVDELMEQERNVKNALTSRAGVLGLMLHSTYNHEVMEMITSQMQHVTQPNP